MPEAMVHCSRSADELSSGDSSTTRSRPTRASPASSARKFTKSSISMISEFTFFLILFGTPTPSSAFLPSTLIERHCFPHSTCPRLLSSAPFRRARCGRTYAEDSDQWRRLSARTKMQTKPDTDDAPPPSPPLFTGSTFRGLRSKAWRNNGTIRNVASPIQGDGKLPRPDGTRFLIPFKSTANVFLQSQITALCLFNGAFSFVIFPYLARAVIPLAFSTMPLQGGRPIADTVLTSVFTPCLGICFSALSAATLGTLRQRQQDIRTQLSQEAILLETLRMPLQKLFRTDRHRMVRSQVLLLAYCRMVQCDSSGLCAHFPRLDLMQLQRRTMLALLAVIGETDAALCEKPPSEAVVFSRIVGYAQSLVNQISSCAAKRGSVYLSGFPAVHWTILLLLAFVIPLDFVVLAATSKGTNMELFDDVFLRFVFTVLCLAVSAVTALLIDLNDPFRPNYRVTEGRRFAPIGEEIQDLLLQLAEEGGSGSGAGTEALDGTSTAGAKDDGGEQAALREINGLLKLAILDPLTVARAPMPPDLDDYIRERSFWL